jgi:uncharacterized phage-associated protein
MACHIGGKWCIMTASHDKEGCCVLTATILSNNILKRAFEQKVKVTPMKLQKLLFFVCKEYVYRTGNAPFSEQFEAWQYGPVLPSVYAEFQAYRKNPITKYCQDSIGDVYLANEKTNTILCECIDLVWRTYRNVDALSLSRLTHRANTAWSFAVNNDRNVITVQDIKMELECDTAR